MGKKLMFARFKSFSYRGHLIHPTRLSPDRLTDYASSAISLRKLMPDASGFNPRPSAIV